MDKELQSLLEGINTANQLQPVEEGVVDGVRNFAAGVKNAFTGIGNGQGVKANFKAGAAESQANDDVKKSDKRAAKANKQTEQDAQAAQQKADTELKSNASKLKTCKLNGKVLGAKDILALAQKLKDGDAKAFDGVKCDDQNEQQILDIIIKSQQNQASQNSSNAENEPAKTSEEQAVIGDKKGDPNWEFILQILNNKLNAPAQGGKTDGQ